MTNSIKIDVPTDTNTGQVRATLSATLTTAEVASGGNRVSKEVTAMIASIAERFNRPWAIEALTVTQLSNGWLLITMVGLAK